MNNAALMATLVAGGGTLDFSPEMWNQAFAVNVTGSWNCARAALKVRQPWELCGALRLFVSPAGHWITGQVVVVDGGIVLHTCARSPRPEHAARVDPRPAGYPPLHRATRTEVAPDGTDVHMDGTTDDVKGRAKEVIGDLTDDDNLKNEGKADRASGKAKDVVSDVKDQADDAIDATIDKVKGALHRD